MRNSELKQHLTAGAVLALAVLAIFGRLTLHPSDLLVGVQRDGRNDVTAHTLAARSVMGQVMREGSLPLWHDKGLLGSPWLGNPQSAMFYPPHWLFLATSAVAAISWLMVLHHWAAGLGVYFLARRQKLSWSAAVLGGICFAGAPFLIAQTAEGHATQVFLVAWTPWGFLAYDHLRRGGSAGWAWLAAVLSMAFFCGHVQEVYYLVLILSGMLVYDLLVRRIDTAPPLKLLQSWLAAGMATIGMVAIELGPNWLYTKFGARGGGLDAQTAGRISAGPENLWQLLNPFWLGDAGRYQGPGQYYWETLCSFGAAPLALAAAGLLLVAFRVQERKANVLLWLVIACGALLFALGNDTPLFPFMHRFVPGVKLFRSPGRALFFTSLACAMLAAWGWDSIVHAWGRLWSSQPAWTAWLNARLGRQALRLLGAGLAVSGCLLCTIELSAYSSQMLATVAAGGLRSDSPIVDVLNSQPQLGRILVRQELLSDREACAAGLDKLRRYEPVPLSRTLSTMSALTSRSEVGREITGLEHLDASNYHKPMLDLLNVSHMVLVASSDRAIPGWRFVAKGHIDEEITLRGRKPRRIPYVIYRNLNCLPRAFVLGATQSPDGVPLDKAMAELDPKQAVLVSSDQLPGGPRQSFKPARIVRRSANRIEIQTSLEAPGYLVLSESVFPGWRAEVNGAVRKVQPVNISLRGVPLEAGEHTVVLKFSPPMVSICAAISMLTFLLLAKVLVRSLFSPEAHAECSATATPPRQAAAGGQCAEALG